MQQVLEQLTNGELEVVADDGNGNLTYIRRPPSSLHLRAVRLIKQLVAERDGMQTSYVSQQSALHDALQEIESLKSKLKEVNNVSKNAAQSVERSESEGSKTSGAHNSTESSP